MLIVLAALKFFFLLITTSWFCAVLTVIRLDCIEAAFKFRIEQKIMRIIGIKIVIIAKEKYNLGSTETSSTKNLEQGRTKHINQTVAIST